MHMKICTSHGDTCQISKKKKKKPQGYTNKYRFKK